MITEIKNKNLKIQINVFFFGKAELNKEEWSSKLEAAFKQALTSIDINIEDAIIRIEGTIGIRE